MAETVVFPVAFVTAMKTSLSILFELSNFNGLEREKNM